MILLYHTDGCHLCEQADAMLQRLGARFERCDIINDERQRATYGWRIPVVASAGGELDWPFDRQQLEHFLTIYRPEPI
ncbi:MAG: glutaredoxin family protein [Gammaproteobacteria bacterium]|nr:glutaredoxin family protein [Gammaproteobacteria bacterium]